MRHTRTGFHTLFSLTASLPPRCAADLVFYRCMRMNPLAPPAGGAFFMHAVLCATGAASAALSDGFAGQRLEPVPPKGAGKGCQVGKPATPLSVVTAGHLGGSDVV